MLRDLKINDVLKRVQVGAVWLDNFIFLILIYKIYYHIFFLLPFAFCIFYFILIAKNIIVIEHAMFWFSKKMDENIPKIYEHVWNLGKKRCNKFYENFHHMFKHGKKSENE